MNDFIQYIRASSIEHLKGILLLQKANLPDNLSSNVKKKEGFVTVRHDLNILKKMNEACPHIIALSDDQVVGYVLCMTKEFADKIPVLIPMFSQIETVIPKDTYFIVMGQVCIDKQFRRKGIFRGLYQHMKTCLHREYKVIITEVDEANTRSVQAHYAIGFKSLKKYKANGHQWDLIGLPI